MTEVICPRCGKPYSDPPALSRADNRTSICPRCGTEEALDVAPLSDTVKKQLIRTLYPVGSPYHRPEDDEEGDAP